MTTLPTATFDEEGSYGITGYDKVIFDGETEYALVAVADGQTPSGIPLRFCTTHDGILGVAIQDDIQLEFCNVAAALLGRVGLRDCAPEPILLVRGAKEEHDG